MTKFKKYNLITGWIVFAIAAFTYVSTIEPTASLWDCGEFIATSYKFEVGHPPGAPFFMIIQKVVSLLAGNNVHKVAMMMNLTSAFASAFTILFLFWSITYIAKKIILKIKSSEELTDGQLYAVLGSGIVGALAYTFSDSFWFSAVEAEVYAMSSMFTALVFWLILKWDEHADEAHSDKWLILIAYLMGLSIGVHLLNLLVIPAIALIYYFRKYKPTVLGATLVFVIGFIVLLFVMYGIIQGLVSFGSGFELFFVNVLGFPFDTGFMFFIILLISAIIFFLWWSKKKNRPALHTSLLALLVMIIGYSSFAMLVIRSSVDPPIDENDPENTFALKAYLNREQYGDRPLLYGQYYDADVISQEKEYTYYRGEVNGKKRYIKTPKTNPKYTYDPSRICFFPRMYSNQQDHISAYKQWGDIPEGQKPTWSNNIKFFLKYQVGFMYMRYFMWNFVGKQNDIQGHGGPLHGNWLSGIKFIDNALVAPQDKLPEKWKNMASRNKYYFLPLILGLIGLLFQLDKDKESFSVILTLFIMTGLAIVVYLNQTPFQPRERDYAYVGSFYAFAFWIGFAVLALFVWLEKYLSKEKLRAITITAVLALVPVLMAFQNWDDHTRAHRYHTRDFASDYLNSCAKNAILFTFGDNDTFPLWYDQEVEGIRTDVRDVNLSLFSTDWYTNQMKRKAYDSDPLPIPIDESKYRMSVRDVVLVHENPNVLFNEKYKANESTFKPTYTNLYKRLMNIVNNSDFASKFPKDYKTLSNFDKLPIGKFMLYVDALAQEPDKFGLNKDSLNQIKVEATVLKNKIADSYALLKDVMAFVLSDDPSTKVATQGGKYDYIPTRKVMIPVDKEHIRKLGFVPEDKMDKVQNVKFEIKGNYLLKANWLVLEILAENNWNRPIYFATSIGRDNYMGLSDYFRLEGFAYRLVPYKTTPSNGEIGDVNTDILYDNVMNKFKWGNIKDPRFNVDNYVKRTVAVMDIRDVFHRLAEALIKENKKDSAEVVLDKCIEVLPDNKIPYDYTVLPIIDDYYKIGKFDKANKIALQLIDNYQQQLTYFNSFPANRIDQLSQRDLQIPVIVFQQLYGSALKNKQDTITKILQPVLMQYMNTNQIPQ